MMFFIQTVAETQKSMLAAAGVFAESVLSTTGRVMELDIELTRTAVETSADVARECIDACLVKDNLLSPNVLLRFAQVLPSE